MTLADDLGYRHRPANAFQRLMQAFGSTRAGARAFSATLRHLDDVVGRVSGGRTSAPELLAGLPVLDVTTTGRKSGQPRRSHLISVPVGEGLAILGTNFGQRNTPAWVFNLEADPHAVVSYRNRTLPAVARPASEAEYAEVFARAAGVYGGYLKYQQRVTHRRIRVFVLEKP